MSTPPAFAHGDGSAPKTVEPGGCATGLTAIRVDGRFFGCTHGPDPAPDGLELSHRPSLASLRPVSARRAAAAAGVPCVGTGTDGKRIQAVYAYTSGTTSRYSAVAPLIRSWAAKVNDVFEASSAETGGARQARFVTTSGSGCKVTVLSVGLSSTAAASFGGTINAMSAKGYKSPSRKYLIWYDTAGYGICGIATMWVDDRPGKTNLANTQPGYTRVDSPCWDRQTEGGALVEAHEVMHNLGAVQDSAPRSSKFGHCTDEFDVMCYFDHSSTQRMTYPCSALHESLFDCGHNDYFNTAPATGSYLAKHWNAARSVFLASGRAPDNDAFAAAAPLVTTTEIGGMRFGLDLRVGANLTATAEAGEPATAGSAPSRSVWYRVTVPIDGQTLTLDTHGSSFDTVLGLYTGTAVNALTPVAENDNANGSVVYSRIAAPVGAGTYSVKVDGKGGKKGAIVLHLGLGTAPPSLTSFSPGTAAVGAPVALDVANLFSGQSFLLALNGVQPSYIDYDDAYTLAFATVPTRYGLGEDAASGPIVFQNESGWAISDTPLRIKPTIASISPTHGPAGTAVTIRGQALLGSAKPVVRFNGKTAGIVSWSYTKVVAKVPSGATSGPLAVATNGGSASKPFSVP